MHLLENGVNLIYIRDILGHASIVTTEVYAKANPEMKRHAIETAAGEDPRTKPLRRRPPGRTCWPGSAKPSEPDRYAKKPGATEPPDQHRHHQLHITEDFTSDEKSQVQALARSPPAFPMMPGHAGETHPRLRPARHDHPVRGVRRRRREGDRRVHRRHRTMEFRSS